MLTCDLPSYYIVADSRVFSRRPLFSVIVAVYNVEEYIQQTLNSFSRQDISSELIEYVIVDDGSQDGSADIAAKFARKHPNVLVVAKSNGGVGETRKLALALARGEWVTSVDPDDIIKKNYFSEAKRFLDTDTKKSISILSSKVLITNGTTGEFKDSHPLGAKFRDGNRVVSMLSDPSAIQMGATVFMQLDVLRKHNLTFDTRIEPTFEDGNLVCRYLAHFDDPTVGLLSTSHYYYRKRADNSSLVQSSWLKPERYSVVPKLGYLAAMEYVEERQGYVPTWLANIVLYDLMWYFKEDEKMGSAVAAIPMELKQEFMGYAREIFAKLTVENLLYLPFNKPSWRLREALIAGFGLDQAPARIFKWGTRNDGTRNYSLVVDSSDHHIEIYLAGKSIDVIPEGITNRLYFDEVMAVEYTINLPDVPTVFFIDGIPCTSASNVSPQDLPIQNGYLDYLTYQICSEQTDESSLRQIMQRWETKSGIQNRSVPAVVFDSLVENIKLKVYRENRDENYLVKAQVEDFIDSGKANRFEHAWLIFDHINRADDNGEHLYRYILQNHEEVNAYYLLSKDSKDWSRLESEGFRLLEYGSVEAMAAALQADIVASSDAVEECIYPAPRRIFGAPNYKFVFLQHGITKDDISRWLNGKKIDLVVAATTDEYNAFTTKDSPYEYKYSQVALTGFPRYDNLFKLVGERSDRSQGPKTLFIMPTWRQDLRDALAECESEEERTQVFLESDFYQNWWTYLSNLKLEEEIRNGSVRVRMMTHPSFGDELEKLPQPFGIEFLHPADHSFQELMNEADIFLTDYSSLAFDVAFMGTPVAYFQFDRDRMLSGTHTYRKGYFDYFEDALGPIITNSDELQEWVDGMLDSGCLPDSIYEERRLKTFKYLDGQNSERVYRVMNSMVNGSWPQEYENLYTVRNGKV